VSSATKSGSSIRRVTVIVGVPLALVAVGGASSCIAARRAARIEPGEALREL
jgi:hypothetical protein